jgi:hypothetical protein
MSAGDLAAVIVSVVMLGVIVALALVVQALLHSLRELRGTLEDLRGEAVPLMGELRSTVERAGAEVERVDDLLDAAESISATVDSASRLGYLAFRAPIIRVAALGRGIGRGTRRLTGRSALDRGTTARAMDGRPRSTLRKGSARRDRPDRLDGPGRAA